MSAAGKRDGRELGSGNPERDGGVPGRDLAGLLGLAAAPIFAAMALLTFATGGRMDTCMAGAALPISGMAPMYLLMCLFHTAPWLRLTSRRQTGRLP